MKYCLIILLLLNLVFAACQPQTAQPLIMIATPQALDASFMTYRHESGVFSLRIPPNWIPDQLPDDNGLRVQFTSVEGTQRVVRLSLTVVNIGEPMTAEAFIRAVNAYQPPADVAQVPWTPTSDLAAMPDGSVRLTGIRDYPTLGARAMNIFLQGNGSYFSALEADVTDIPPDVFDTLLAVVNTYRIDPNMPLNVGKVAPSGVTTASGVLVFQNYWQWEDTNGGFNITGQVLNTAEEDFEAVRLTAYLYDDQDNLLAEQSDVLVYDVLASQETAPFRLRFDTGRPTTAVRYEIHAAARTAEFASENFYGSTQFLVGNHQASYNLNGNLVIQGVVQNNGVQLASRIKIIATVFDEQGRVVGAESTFVNKDSLLPQEATNFEITIYDLGGNAYRYVLVAQGQTE